MSKIITQNTELDFFVSIENLKIYTELYKKISGSDFETTKIGTPSYLLLRKIGLGFVLPLAMSLNGAGEFLFCYEILNSFLKLSHPVLLISSLTMTVLSSVLFYSFEIALLKKALGIPDYQSIKSQEYQQIIEFIHRYIFLYLFL